jgi:hypothetical protein
MRADNTRVKDYIFRLDNFDGPAVAEKAIEYELYEEAFEIYKKFNRWVWGRVCWVWNLCQGCACGLCGCGGLGAGSEADGELCSQPYPLRLYAWHRTRMARAMDWSTCAAANPPCASHA